MSESAAAPELLGVRNVSVRYGGVTAVDDLSLSVARGELIGLVGPNGSGKSTLLAVISRVARLDGGGLFLNGIRYDNQRPSMAGRMGIGRTFQTVRLLPRLTVLENVMLGADEQPVSTGLEALASSLRGLGVRERRSRARAITALDRVGLGDLAETDVRTLSYGIQRKIEIARALASEPVVLLLDEPTAGMSRMERDEVGQLISDLWHQGLAQVLVEHDVAMMVNTCPRLIAMNQGRLIADGEPVAVVRDPAVRAAYLGSESSVS